MPVIILSYAESHFSRKIKYTVFHPYDFLQIYNTALMAAVEITVQIFYDVIQLAVKPVYPPGCMDVDYPQFRFNKKDFSGTDFGRFFSCDHWHIVFLIIIVSIRIIDRTHTATSFI